VRNAYKILGGKSNWKSPFVRPVCMKGEGYVKLVLD
jgi:hypothetical protein